MAMRILFAGVEPFIPDCYSAPNRTVLELSQKLASMGHEPAVLSGTSSMKGKQVFCDHSFSFPVYRSSHPLQSFPALVTTVLPDIVILTGRNLTGLLKIAAKMDFPIAIWLFDTEYQRIDYQVFDDLLFNAGIRFLATSSFVSDHARAFLGVSAEVVPPFIEEPGEIRSDPGNQVLFFNPSRRKGVELAFKIARERPAIQFTFVETWCLSDDWRNYCFQQAAKCGNIDWRKPVLNMHELYRKARLMLVPSICEEGFCRGVTEAQRFGIPVVASDRGYLPANVGDGGAIINLHEPLSVWLEAFDRLWESAGSYTGQMSLTREHAFRKELETGNVAGQFISLLQSYVEESSRTRQNLRDWSRGEGDGQ